MVKGLGLEQNKPEQRKQTLIHQSDSNRIKEQVFRWRDARTVDTRFCIYADQRNEESPQPYICTLYHYKRDVATMVLSTKVSMAVAT
jgi:hypothetical protein